PPPLDFHPLSLHDALPISDAALRRPPLTADRPVQAPRGGVPAEGRADHGPLADVLQRQQTDDLAVAHHRHGGATGLLHPLEGAVDRKSTRLNSSHVKISYA